MTGFKRFNFLWAILLCAREKVKKKINNPNNIKLQSVMYLYWADEMRCFYFSCHRYCEPTNSWILYSKNYLKKKLSCICLKWQQNHMVCALYVRRGSNILSFFPLSARKCLTWCILLKYLYIKYIYATHKIINTSSCWLIKMFRMLNGRNWEKTKVLCTTHDLMIIWYKIRNSSFFFFSFFFDCFNWLIFNSFYAHHVLELNKWKIFFLVHSLFQYICQLTTKQWIFKYNFEHYYIICANFILRYDHQE